MEVKPAKSINYYIRVLHRDIGFFLIGLTVIYCISGIVLTYRDIDFLKHEVKIEKTLSLNLSDAELGKVLHKRDFEVKKTVGDTLYFKGGTYNKATGHIKYKDKVFPTVLDKFNSLHRTSSKNIVHYFSVIFGVLLFFLAVSSFWMFNTKTKQFRRGIILASLGLVFSIVLLFI